MGYGRCVDRTTAVRHLGSGQSTPLSEPLVSVIDKTVVSRTGREGMLCSGQRNEKNLGGTGEQPRHGDGGFLQAPNQASGRVRTDGDQNGRDDLLHKLENEPVIVSFWYEA